MKIRTIYLAAICVGLSILQGCLSSSTGFESIRVFLDSNADAIVLEGEAGSIAETYGRIMADESYEAVGAPPDLLIKDLGQLIEAANSADVPMPIAAHMRNNFLTALGRGYGDMDLAVVGKVMAENAGLE